MTKTVKFETILRAMYNYEAFKDGDIKTKKNIFINELFDRELLSYSKNLKTDLIVGRINHMSKNISNFKELKEELRKFYESYF